MRKLGFFIFILVATVFLSGCLSYGKKASNTPVANQSVSTTDSSIINSDSNQPVDSNSLVKKFYPEKSNLIKNIFDSGTTEPTVTGDIQDFLVTPQLLVKIYLVDKYGPGTCYGLPSAVPESAIESMLVRNPGLAQFLRNRYKLDTDLAVYNKIKEFNGITLTELSGGKYKFSFTDGQCCTLTYYEGIITIIGQNISETITNQDSKTNPC